MAGRVLTLLLALSSPVAGGLTGCRLARMITGKSEEPVDPARGDLIEALGDQIEADRQQAGTTRMGIVLGAGALLLVCALILFFIVRAIVRLLRGRDPSPAKAVLVDAVPAAVAAGPAPIRPEPAQSTEVHPASPAAASDETFEAFIGRSLEEGTPERMVVLECAERLDRLGSDIAAGALPFEATLNANALPIAEDWSFCLPLVEHLRRLGPAGGDGVVAAEWTFRNAEWLGSLAAVSLASWCDGRRVECILARIGPVSRLERRAKNLLETVEISRRLRREVAAYLRHARRERRRRAR